MANLTIEPLTPTIGAELSGVDLRDDLGDSVMAEIEQALLDWKVVFFRDQDIATDDHLRFGRWFGPLEVHPLTPPGVDVPEILQIAEDATSRARNDIWHTDVTFEEEPPLGSILRARVIPPVGGDTMFADMYAAYEGLDDATRERIADAVAVHDFHGFRRGMRARGVPESEIDEFKKRFPPPEHPVVRTHPRTGRRSLFVNAAFTTHIVGLDEDESRTLLDHLYRQARVPEYQCRFRWRVNSIAFWDNRCTQHYAVADFHPARRVVQRVTVRGDRPV